MTDPLSAFQPKAIQGLYLYNHFERSDGAWFQTSIDSTRPQVTYCASPSEPFHSFPDLATFRIFLETQPMPDSNLTAEQAVNRAFTLLTNEREPHGAIGLVQGRNLVDELNHYSNRFGVRITERRGHRVTCVKIIGDDAGCVNQGHRLADCALDERGVFYWED